MFRKDDIRIIVTMIVGLFLLSFALEARATNCNRHPIYCQIKKNKPKINKRYAMKLSNVIYRAIRKHHIPPRIFTAILAQESSYTLKAKGCHSGLAKQLKPTNRIGLKEHIIYTTPIYKESDYYMKEVRICSDFGIGQIYYKTARGFKFNIEQLTNDLEYSIEAAAIVLADFKKRYERREVTWWTRYNARSKIKRRIYRQLVERYF